MAICFLRKTCRDPLEKQLDPMEQSDPLGPIALREIHMTLCEKKHINT